MENHQFGNTGGSWQSTLTADFTIAIQAHIPEPRRRAIADSFFTSLEAGAGDILYVFYLLSEKNFVCEDGRNGEGEGNGREEILGEEKRSRRKIGLAILINTIQQAAKQSHERRKDEELLGLLSEHTALSPIRVYHVIYNLAGAF